MKKGIVAQVNDLLGFALMLILLYPTTLHTKVRLSNKTHASNVTYRDCKRRFWTHVGGNGARSTFTSSLGHGTKAL